ncbi:hypothetical protein HKX48_002272 [Thoreauomyces humboldtii]|nr:hypothetical protein HKX48_002272 [Thoreauomyces humboldtii]
MASLVWTITTALKREVGLDLSWFIGGTVDADSTAHQDSYWGTTCSYDPPKHSVLHGPNNLHGDDGDPERLGHEGSDYIDHAGGKAARRPFDTREDDDDRTVVTSSTDPISSSSDLEFFDCDDDAPLLQDHHPQHTTAPAFASLLDQGTVVTRLLQHSPRLRTLCAQTYYHSLTCLPPNPERARLVRTLRLHPPDSNSIWIGDLAASVSTMPGLITLDLSGASSGCVSNLLGKILSESCPLLNYLAIAQSDAITHGFLRSLHLPSLRSLILSDLPGLPAQTALVLALDNHPKLNLLRLHNLPPDSNVGLSPRVPHVRLTALDLTCAHLPPQLIPLACPHIVMLRIKDQPLPLSLPPLVASLPRLRWVDARGTKGHVAGSVSSLPGNVSVLCDGVDDKDGGVLVTHRLVRAFTM